MMLRRFHILLGVAIFALIAQNAVIAREIRISKAYGPYIEPPFAEQIDAVNDVWKTNTLIAITHPYLIYNVPLTSPGDLVIIFEDSSTYNIFQEMSAFEPDYFFRKTIRWEMGNAGGGVKYPNVIMKAADGQTPTIDYSGLPNDNQVGGRNAIQIFHVHPADRTFTFEGIRFINRDVNESPNIASGAIRQGGNGTIILKRCVSESISPIVWINRWDATESPVMTDTVPEIENCAFTVLKGTNPTRLIAPIFNFYGAGQFNITDSTFVLKAESPDPITTATTSVVAELAPGGTRPDANYVTSNTIIRNFTTMLNMEAGFDATKLVYEYNIDFPAVAGKVAGPGNLTVDPLLVSDFPSYLIDFDNSPAVGAGVNGTTIGYAKSGNEPVPTAVRNFTLYQ